MRTEMLPLARMTSALALMEYYKERTDLPVDKEEARALLLMAPEKWRDQQLVFPKTILQGKGGAQSILVAKRHSKPGEWKTTWIRAVSNGLNVSGAVPQHVSSDARVLSRVGLI